MKTKFKVLATVLSMALVLAVATVGVFAATQSTVSASNGSINFNSAGVYVSVNGAITDELGTDYSAKQYSQKNFNEGNLSESSSAALTSWDIGNVYLSEDNTFVSYTLTIVNAGDFSIHATYTAPQDITGLEITAKENMTAIQNGGNITITKGESKTIVINAKLIDYSKSILSAQFTFGFSFIKAI